MSSGGLGRAGKETPGGSQREHDTAWKWLPHTDAAQREERVQLLLEGGQLVLAHTGARETMGDGNAVLLRAHGAVLAAAGVNELFMPAFISRKTPGRSSSPVASASSPP